MTDSASAPRRRNPQAKKPHRTRGPAPPPDPKVAAALAKAEAKEKARARRLWLLNFKRTRGYPPGTDPGFIETCRRQGVWYMGIRPPDY